MLKKFLILGLVVLLSLSIAAPAFAQEGGEVGGETTEGSGEDTTVPEDPHPIVLAISERYGVTYAEVAAMFNGTMKDYQPGTEGGEEGGETGGETGEEAKGYGLGEIMLAYQTAQKLGDGTTAEQLLAEKDALGGWGKVWQEHGLIGKDHAKQEKSNNGKSDEHKKEKTNNGNHGGNKDK